MSFLNQRTDDHQANVTADYLVNGRHMHAKRMISKTLYKWLRGLSKEFGRIETLINSVVDGFDIRKNLSLLEMHEERVGIPDRNYLDGAADDIRSRQVQIKIGGEGINTATDFEWLSFDIGGMYVTVYPGMYFYDSGISPNFSNDTRVSFANASNDHIRAKKSARFTTVFEFDYSQSTVGEIGEIFPVSFPWSFGLNTWNSTTRFFTDLLPSNVNGQYIYAGTAIDGFGHGPMGHTIFGGIS